MATLQTWGQVLGGQVSLGKSIAAAFLACLPAFHVTEAWSGADSIPEPPRRPALPSARPEAVETQATETEAVDPSEPSSERKTYRALLKREAEKNGLPFDIADAVMAIESGYDPSVIGSVGEIGLMQVRPSTAAMLGFKGGETELAKPEVNIHYGVSYLGQAWHLANGDLCRALMKYRAGHGEEVMTPLSVSYCGRARAHLAAVGSPYGAGATPIFPLASLPGRMPMLAARHRPRIRTADVSRAFWAAHEARVRAISARIEAKWRRMAAR